jgi:hypothetical protein
MTARPLATQQARRPPTSFSAEVEIDAYDLHHQGWHHQDECEQLGAEEAELLAALDELHRLAHNGSGGSLYARHCRREPCMDVWGGR